MANKIRKTKIIATVGPACESQKKLRGLIDAGVNMFRINASHTTSSELGKWIDVIHKTTAKSKKHIPIMVDLQGPRVRTGKLVSGTPVYLNHGQNVIIKPSKKLGTGRVITTPTMQITKMVHVGDSILIDNGFIELKVLQKKRKEIKCRVVAGGFLGENKGINLPNAPVTLPALTSKDQQDLKVAAKKKVDYIALSFVRSKKDIQVLRNWLKRHHADIPIISKIEKPRAVRSMKSIVEASDGIMVARGDLGIEMGVEKIPVVQKDIVSESNRMRIPVITATQMLESMIQHTRPTRAEASDVANAVFDGTDAVMLSGETAVGRNPVMAVKMMSRIILEAEDHVGEYHADTKMVEMIKAEELSIHAITHAARHAANDLGAKAILVYTLGGKTAMLISKFRPKNPVIALTPSDQICRRLAICRGIQAVKIKYQRNTDAMIREGEKVLIRNKLLKKGDAVVIVSGRQALPAARYMTKIQYIGEKKS